MTKLKAFITHLGISIVIFILLAAYIVYFWYPQPFFTSDGGWHGLRIVAAVDIVLGPFLTLIVYKAGKPRLKMDLTIIGLIQAAALSWGVWVVHYERPMAAVFTLNHWATITANDLKNRGFDGDKLKPFGERTPVFIYSDLPEKTNELQELLKDAMSLQRGLQHFTEYYKPVDEDTRQRILNKSLDLEAWVKENPEFSKEYELFVKKHKSDLDNIAFFAWHARYKRTVIAMTRDNLNYVASLAIRPPEVEKQELKYVE